MEPPPAPPPPADKPPAKGGLAQKMDKHRTTRNTGAATPPRNDLSPRLVVRNLCNDGLIGTGSLTGHTGLTQTIAGQSVIPPVISRLLGY